MDALIVKAMGLGAAFFAAFMAAAHYNGWRRRNGRPCWDCGEPHRADQQFCSEGYYG